MELNKIVFRIYAKKCDSLIFVCHHNPGVKHLIGNAKYGFIIGNHYFNDNLWEAAHFYDGTSYNPAVLKDNKIPKYGDL